MTTPNWRKFAAIPWTSQTMRILDALGIRIEDIPPEGRPSTFEATTDTKIKCYTSASIDREQVFTCFNGKASAQFGNCFHGDDILKFMNFRKGYTNDKTLRQWLMLWGWQPTEPCPNVNAPKT